LTEAEDGTEGEEEDYDDDDNDNDDADRPSVQSPKVVHIIGPSAKDRLTTKFDTMFDRFAENPSPSSERRQAQHYEAALSSCVNAPRMYLLHVTSTSIYLKTKRHDIFTHCIPGNSTDYITEQLRSQGFHVTVSIWTAGQLYVVADSPRAIMASLPISHAFAVKQYLRVPDDEREAVERSGSKLPSPAWVRIKHGKYKGDIGYVLNSDPSNHLIAILIPPRCFPYPMPSRSVALLDRFRLPNDQTVRDVICDGKVTGFSYKGEQYYKGLLLKNFHRDRLELVASPHADDIRLHMESGFDTPFVKKTLAAFSLQFLCIGDSVRVIAGELRPNIGTVISTDYVLGSVRLETILGGNRRSIDVRLEDVDRIFRVGDDVRVVAGPYLGLEGQIIQISDDMFHVCQGVSKEEVRLVPKLKSKQSNTRCIGTCFEVLFRPSPFASHPPFIAAHAATLRLSL
jgi:ribosomal protein L24